MSGIPARGLDGVVAAHTRLSLVDGQAGRLVIGGHEPSELAGRVTFEEAAHRLGRGELPGREEAEAMRNEVVAMRTLRESTMRAEDHLIRPQSEYTGPLGPTLSR